MTSHHHKHWFSHVFVFFLLAAVSVQSHSAWQVTKFELFQGPPIESDNWQEEESEDFFTSMSEKNAKETELFLHEVAKELSRLTFADPLAEGYFDSLVTKADGTQAIRVYYYQHEASNAPYAWYSGGEGCSSPKTTRKIINLNKNWYAANGRITDMNYQTLAHELFHAVQASSEYAKKFKCSGPNWITEGTADAMGIHLARSLRDIKFTKEFEPGNNQILKIIGAREYSYPLHLPHKPGGANDAEYMTSSFWRYLAEEAYASKHGKQYAGSAKSKENYEYLASFFNQPFGVHTGPAGQLNWLNQRMESETDIRGSLAHLYPIFAASYADFMEARIAPKMGIDGQDKTHKWLIQGFTNCNSAGSVGNGISTTIDINIKPISARCFKVNVIPGAVQKNIFLQIMHTDKSILEQLQIGLPDGTDVRPPFILSYQKDQPPHIAIWTFPNLFTNDGTYIISNVAETPAQTKLAELNVHFSMSDWDADMVELPPPPPPPKPAPPAETKRPTQKEKQRKAIDEILKNPLDNLQPLTRIDRDKKKAQDSCGGTKRQLNLCGPQLKIKLSLSPFEATLASMGPSSYGFEAISIIAQGGLNSNEYRNAIVEMETALEAMDGSEIHISIPLVDYGYTGSVNNARIKVNKANTKDRGYEAYGPPVDDGRYKHWRPPTGKVNITQYSHQAIAGTFSANLIDESLRQRADNPVVAKTINGSFFIPAPALHDKDFEISSEHLKEQMIQSSIQQTPFGTKMMQDLIQDRNLSPQALCEQGVDEDQIKAMGFVDGCSGVTESDHETLCSCECDAREKEEKNTNCERVCANEWKRCPLPDHLVTDELAAEVAEYQRLMTERNIPPEMQNTMIESFKKMPEWQRNLTLQGFK